MIRGQAECEEGGLGRGTVQGVASGQQRARVGEQGLEEGGERSGVQEYIVIQEEEVGGGGRGGGDAGKQVEDLLAAALCGPSHRDGGGAAGGGHLRG